MITFENLQGDDYATGCLLDYQKISFTGNLERNADTTMFSLLQKQKRNYFTFFTINCESIVNIFCFNIIV